MTTNGLLLDAELAALVTSGPDKVHVSIHFPGAILTLFARPARRR